MTQKEIKEILDFLTGDDELCEDGTPGSHDGPWATNWEERCGQEYLKEAFVKANKLAHHIRSLETKLKEMVSAKVD